MISEPYWPNDFPWMLMLIGVVMGGLFEVAWSWARRGVCSHRWAVVGECVGAGLVLGAVVSVVGLHLTKNPLWVPSGQDYCDYIGYTASFLAPEYVQPDNIRYPLFAWLASLISRGLECPPYLATMGLSLASSALLVVGLYLLGRQLAPWPVAVLGAIVPITFPGMVAELGMPSDYVFCSAILVFVLAAGVAALRRGGSWRFLLFGLSCAVLLVATSKAVMVLLVCVGVVIAHVFTEGVLGRRRVLVAPLLWMAPIVVAWLLVAAPNAHSWTFEHQAFKVQMGDRGSYDGLVLEPRAAWGWGESDDEWGYWRAGDPESLKHLGRTLMFAIYPAENRLPLAVCFQRLTDGLCRDLGTPRIGFLILALFGTTLAGNPGPGSVGNGPWNGSRSALFFRWSLVSTLLVSVGAQQVAGLLSVTYVFRYAQPLLVLLPLLVFAGLASLLSLARRPGASRFAWLWVPCLILGLSPLASRSGPLSWERLSVDTRSRSFQPPITELFWRLPELGPDTQVVDLTSRREGSYLLLGTDVPLVLDADERLERSGLEGLVLEPSSVRRRLLFWDRTSSNNWSWQIQAIARTIYSEPDRFSIDGCCFVEDHHPELPLVVHPSLLPFGG